MPTPSEKMLTRLRAMGLDIPDGSVVQRTHAGYWQRRAGAWSWSVFNPERPDINVGSTWPLSILLRRPMVITQSRKGEQLNIDPRYGMSATPRERMHFSRVIEEGR